MRKETNSLSGDWLNLSFILNASGKSSVFQLRREGQEPKSHRLHAPKLCDWLN